MNKVLVYHTIDSPTVPMPSDIDVSAGNFEQHLRWLANRRDQVTDLYSLLTHSDESGFFSITFDDGFQDNLTVALPLLEKYELPMTLFATAEFIGKESYLSAAELRELADHPLITIGSHGFTHSHFSRMTVDEAEHELTASKKFLENITGNEVDLFAYPYGDCSAATEKIVESCGYKAAWSVWNGTNSRFSKWRIPLGRYDNLVRFIVKASPVYFPVKRFLRPPEVRV
jgi:peptidoglycan/xylan/chitin deacetylase (PgdA/CDA1 family)